MTVTVVGIDGDALPPAASAVVERAEVVVGDRERLARHAPDGALAVGLDPLPPALDEVERAAGAGQPVAVLVAGDPGLDVVLRALRARGLRPAVVPTVSTVRRLLARLGRPADDVVVVSAHGRDATRALNVCRARPSVAVLTAPGAGPAEIGAGLVGWRRTLVVVEDLGGERERVVSVDPEEAARRTWSDPGVLLCLADPDALAPLAWHAGGEPTPPAGGWALPEDAFAHRDGMVTPAEVRAVALARLAPRPGELVWDVGAGSGAVAVECARMGAAVIAVERDPVQCVRVVANAGTHQVDVRVVEDEAPRGFAGLPRPDAVFVGGGGPEVVAACADLGADRVVVALSAFDRLGSTRDVLRAAGYQVAGCQISVSRMAELSGDPTGATTGLTATNPVFLIWGAGRNDQRGTP
ncbi:precorrin-6y C5,15-methyltransferase (decarboxylating) subunit CbiE [Streptoalloteichus tenebrarius]|uniref:precorrin-6y C5,15-methyltransferase (decarboxylating) subunit CbiE n=1 Tax=Streptoalloteichus tenebrarius (strain ATCC 17920 / DSM 40477 / JCM 4838 / CBS 697.72 / NBRC 16177 / NCIMB 11028 / NRRL B-12390 / A12253. 1 / ISP 5477) TaxID=1933 RepID=UPI0020A335D4|nr:precorrin-6y C5,15-methyltransferase (decarboxylating) subunit CbiE [Streptoalloteichus tenebrarius]